jgi:cytochrome c peroxidase
MVRSLFAVLLLTATQCTHVNICSSATPPAAAALIKKYAADFSRETEALDVAARDFQTRHAGVHALQARLEETRLAYKRVEFMLEYYYPEHVKAYLNGVPLRHPDPYPYEEMPLPEAYYDNPDYINIAPLDYEEPNALAKPRNILEPEGLQALDEILFSENPGAAPDRIAQLTRALAMRSRIAVQALVKRRYIEDYQIIEATRLELVRLFALGLTGFDTPGSLNAIDEARATLGTLARVTTATIGSRPAVDSLFSASLDLLKGQRFDDLDRLKFLTHAVNPLYQVLQEVHESLKLKNSSDLTPGPQAWNTKSRNLFGNDFLNPYAYTLLQERQDSDALRRLGKKMFYDAALSADGSMSCSSCHDPARAFTDGVPRSRTRNAPTLVNAVLSDRFFYDLRAFSLEEQITNVVENPTEFNTRLDIVAARASERSDYGPLISAAFGDGEASINRYQAVTALASYVVSLRSFNSPFDQYVRGETREIEPLAAQGFNLFMGKAACGTCHYAPTFSGLTPPLYQENESEVLGVLQSPQSVETDADPGRARNGRREDDLPIFNHSFKTVTVRNAELTAPYFHNGAYQTLEDVVEFYDRGGALGTGAHDLSNQTLSPKPLHLTAHEKAALKAFLLSLTDRCALEQWREPTATKVAISGACNTTSKRQ